MLSKTVLCLALVGSAHAGLFDSVSSLLGGGGSAKPNDVWLKTVKCDHLDKEGNPYIYAGIDASWLPGSTKYIKTSAGKQTGLIDSTRVATFLPYNTLVWKNVKNPRKLKIETYVYGEDSFRPDDSLGDADLDLSKVPVAKPGQCAIGNFAGTVVDSEFFSKDATCDYLVAICPPNVAPKDPVTQKVWDEPPVAQTYSF